MHPPGTVADREPGRVAVVASVVEGIPVSVVGPTKGWVAWVSHPCS